MDKSIKRNLFIKAITTPPQSVSIWKYYTGPTTENQLDEDTGPVINTEVKTRQIREKNYRENIITAERGYNNHVDTSENNKHKDPNVVDDTEEDSWTTHTRLGLRLIENIPASSNEEIPHVTIEFNSQHKTSNEFELNRKLNEILEHYLNVLDRWQQEVYNIRIVHHEVWKYTRITKNILHHRAGSRVESQTRILQPGKETDVDYMFEISGVLVDCDEPSMNMYWKESDESYAYGTVFVKNEFKEKLQQDNGDIFKSDTFEWCEEEKAFLLVPNKFKENVINASKFEFHKDSKVPAFSPSVPGRGAINEYDTVPCLQLIRWPKCSYLWKQRGSDSDRFAVNIKWKKTIMHNVPLFLVPTGNPLSENKYNQFRLSFSMVEIKCFSIITPAMRKNYGIAKYIFKRVFCSQSCDLLSSYHIKTLFLWMTEEISISEWEKLSPLDFISDIFAKIRVAIVTENIRHYFISGCNIFPKHKITSKNLELYEHCFKSETEIISRYIFELLGSDLNLCMDMPNFLEQARNNLDEMNTKENMDRYIRGYLTRLLSMITFSLFENYKNGTLKEATNKIRKVFESYKFDKHIGKIVSEINICLISLQIRTPTIITLIPNCINCTENISAIAHAAFELYLSKQYRDVRFMIKHFRRNVLRTNCIGVSVTKYHKPHVDIPIRFMIDALEKRLSTCQRFYLDPYLMIKHLQIQTELIKWGQPYTTAQRSRLQNHMTDMEAIANQLSEQEPYIGKLSYKFAAYYLLHGYKNLYDQSLTPTSLTITPNISLDSFNQRMFAKNFDLR